MLARFGHLFILSRIVVTGRKIIRRNCNPVYFSCSRFERLPLRIISAKALDAILGTWDVRRLHDRITETSDCYPRHVQSCLRGLAKECISGTHIDTERALRRGQEYRIDFYNEIVRDSKIDEIKEVLIELVKHTPSPGTFSRKDMKRVAAQFDMTPERFESDYERAIHGGVIVESQESVEVDAPVTFSVPSMRTFFSTGLQRERTLDLLKQVGS